MRTLGLKMWEFDWVRERKGGEILDIYIHTYTHTLVTLADSTQRYYIAEGLGEEERKKKQ